MRLAILTIVLLLASCGKAPLEPEPELYVDICIDTFGPPGGRTYTFRHGDSIVIPPWPERPAALIPE